MRQNREMAYMSLNRENDLNEQGDREKHIKTGRLPMQPGELEGMTQFYRISKSKALLNFHESWFLTLAFPRGLTQLYRISKDTESFFCQEVSRVK